MRPNKIVAVIAHEPIPHLISAISHTATVCPAIPAAAGAPYEMQVARAVISDPILEPRTVHAKFTLPPSSGYFFSVADCTFVHINSLTAVDSIPFHPTKYSSSVLVLCQLLSSSTFASRCCCTATASRRFTPDFHMPTPPTTTRREVDHKHMIAPTMCSPDPSDIMRSS